MTEAGFLGIDIGGTASRWVLCDVNGAEMARGAGAGATGHVFNPVERERLSNSLGDVARQLGEGRDLHAVTLGLTGFGRNAADEVRQLVADRLAVASDRVTVTDDIVLAYASVFRPGEGHLVSAGTGSIGLHLGTQGADHVRVGGRGILIDDGGSGSWIALRALDLVLRRLDATGTFDAAQPLAGELLQIVGGDDWHAIRQFVYGSDRGRIGMLARGVGKAAAAGDAIALSVLADAGRELAALARALMSRAGDRPIAFIGGVLELHPVLRDAIAESLAGATVCFPSADAALAGARLHLPANADWRAALATITGL